MNFPSNLSNVLSRGNELPYCDETKKDSQLTENPKLNPGTPSLDKHQSLAINVVGQGRNLVLEQLSVTNESMNMLNTN